jgi:WD40 repeat protein
MGDPCQRERDALSDNKGKQLEIQGDLDQGDLPSDLITKLRKQLARLNSAEKLLLQDLKRCQQAHQPPAKPEIPKATLRSTRELDGSVSAVAVCGPPQRRAVAGHEKLTIFETDTGELVRNLTVPGVMGLPVLNPTGEFFVVGSSDKTLRVFDIDGNDLWRAAHSAGIISVAISPRTGKLIATGADVGDKKVRVFTSDLSGDDPAGHRPVWENRQLSSVRRVAISADDKFVAAACQDRSVRLSTPSTATP